MSADTTMPERTLAEAITWVLPLLKEYSEKLHNLGERMFHVGVAFGRPPVDLRNVMLPEVGRLVCLQEMLQRRVEPVRSVASGLLEHAPLDDETRSELALRWDEIEEGLRFSKLQVDGLVAVVKDAGWLDNLRKAIEKSGRYKSPV